MSTSRESPRVSLIVEGGGLRGFFAVGALDRLRQEGLSFPYIIGISSGALSAVAYLAGHSVDFDALTGGLGALTIAHPLGLLRPSTGLFRTDAFVKQLVGDSFEKALHAPSRLIVEAVDALTVQQVWWDQSDCADADDLAMRVRASCTLPVLMPKTEVDGRVYVDGGIGDSLPLAHAIADGCTKHVLICTRPAGYRKDPHHLDLYERMWLRPYPALREAVLTRYVRYNDSMARVERAEQAGNAVTIRPKIDWHGRFVYSKRVFKRDWQAGWDTAESALPRIRALMEPVAARAAQAQMSPQRSL